MVNMNDSSSWTKASNCDEQRSVVEDMNDSKSWAQGSR